ncbi:MAG: excalibur calcium-binding domain-containing protein [Pseudomonadota bacterium]
MRLLFFACFFVVVIAVYQPAQAKSCKDFATYEQALRYYKERKESGRTGWKKLDRDRDGRPCECLPGGRKSDENACKAWRKKVAS